MSCQGGAAGRHTWPPRALGRRTRRRLPGAAVFILKGDRERLKETPGRRRFRVGGADGAAPRLVSRAAPADFFRRNFAFVLPPLPLPFRLEAEQEFRNGLSRAGGRGAGPSLLFLKRPFRGAKQPVRGPSPSAMGRVEVPKFGRRPAAVTPRQVDNGRIPGHETKAHPYRRLRPRGRRLRGGGRLVFRLRRARQGIPAACRHHGRARPLGRGRHLARGAVPAHAERRRGGWHAVRLRGSRCERQSGGSYSQGPP